MKPIIICLVILMLATVAFSELENATCDVYSCSACYNLLVYNVLKSDCNQFNLQKTFSPPEKANPVYVIVYYNFNDANGECVVFGDEESMDKFQDCRERASKENTTWFWTEYTFYNLQPIPVLQFTSLFFTDPSMRMSEICITLDSTCRNASSSYIQLLTHRLKLLTMKGFELSPEIYDNYEPKADNAITINDKQDKYAFRFVIAYQIVGPVITMLASLIFVTYFRMNKSTIIEEFNQDKTNRRGWEIRRNKFIIISMSLYVVVYILCLDVAAMIFKNKLQPAFKDWYLGILTGSPISYVVVDTVGLFCFIFALVLCCCIGKCKISEKCVWYFISFPVFIVTGHVDQIIIGFTHNVYHASAVFILYGLVFIMTATFLKIVSEVVFDKCINSKTSLREENIWSFVTYCFLPIIGFTCFGLLVAMLVLLPINIPFDDAPNKLLTFYQGTIIVFAAYFTYWLFLKKPQSPLDPLIKATDNRLTKKGRNQWNDKDKEWAKKTTSEKMEETAEKLLKIMDKASQNNIKFQITSAAAPLDTSTVNESEVPTTTYYGTARLADNDAQAES